MSVAELKRAVDTLSLEERLELADYLRGRSEQDDPEWEAELGRRLDRCLEGKGHTADELLALHERLSADGR
jgi:DNA primase catalytic subunit